MKSWYLNKKSSITFYGIWPKYEKLRGKYVTNAPITDACNPLNYANIILLTSLKAQLKLYLMYLMKT